jgi:hypothetical protein
VFPASVDLRRLQGLHALGAYLWRKRSGYARRRISAGSLDFSRLSRGRIA